MAEIGGRRDIQRRYVPVLVLALGLAGSLAVAATLPPTENASTRASTETVCGGLAADPLFPEELGQLGRGHACEHLQSRTRPTQEPPLFRQVSQKTHSHAAAGAVARMAAKDPAVVGRWTSPRNPGTRTIGITAVLLHTGKVLLFGAESQVSTTTTAFLYNPATGGGHPVPVPAPIFCGSVTPLSDGRILSVGGANPLPRGIVDLWLFDPVTEEWTRQPDSPLGRYYPTSTRLADGRVVIAGGRETRPSIFNPTIEVYRPPVRGDVGTLRVVGPEHVTAIYPHHFLMPDGAMLQVDRQTSYRLNPATWRWRNLPDLPVNSGVGAAHLMLPGGPSGSNRVMMIGGLRGGTTGVDATQYYNHARPRAGWRLGPPMPTSRGHMNVVQVPNGSAFGIGGNGIGISDIPYRRAMHFSDKTGKWTNMAAQQPRRAYHSTALLLPDGRIMSTGDDRAGGGKHLVDIYKPPYLFRGKRPRIFAAPRRLTYGHRFAIRASGQARRAVLMAPGATTHANEMNARHVTLAVRKTSRGLSAKAPASGRIAPPGHYMLFVLNDRGVPSVARWVHISR
jgi:hypothetical protein